MFALFGPRTTARRPTPAARACGTGLENGHYTPGATRCKTRAVSIQRECILGARQPRRQPRRTLRNTPRSMPNNSKPAPNHSQTTCNKIQMSAITTPNACYGLPPRASNGSKSPPEPLRNAWPHHPNTLVRARPALQNTPRRYRNTLACARPALQNTSRRHTPPPS